MPEEKHKRLTNEVTIVGNLIYIAEEIEERGKSEVIRARVEQPGTYPNLFEVEFLNDRIDDVLEFEDQMPCPVRIRGSLNGRQWIRESDQREFLFLSLIGWSIKPADAPEATKPMSEKRKKRSKASMFEDDDAPMPGDDEQSGDPEDSLPGEEKEQSEKRKARKPKSDPEAATNEDVPY